MTDHIIKAAIEAGVAVTVHKGKPGGPWAVSHVVTPDLERFYAIAYRAGLEDAAKKCEAIADEYERTEGRKYPELKSDAQTGASDCEYAIRALMKETP